MNIAKRWILATVLAGSVAGGALGGSLLSSSAGNAAGNAATTTSSSTPSAAPSSKFVPKREPVARSERERSARGAGGRRSVPDCAVVRPAAKVGVGAHPAFAASSDILSRFTETPGTVVV